MFSPLEYIDSIKPMTGIAYSDDISDTVTWKGYLLLLRYDLSSYKSVDDWKEDMPHRRAYMIRNFGYGSPDVVDARYGYHPIQDVIDAKRFESEGVAYIIDTDVTDVRLLIKAIDMMLKVAKKEPLQFSDEEVKRYQKQYDSLLKDI